MRRKLRDVSTLCTSQGQFLSKAVSKGMMSDKTEREKRQEAQRAEFLELLEASFDYTPPERGEIRSATILQIDSKGDVIVDLGAKQDGIVPAQDLERLDPAMRESLRSATQSSFT